MYLTLVPAIVVYSTLFHSLCCTTAGTHAPLSPSSHPPSPFGLIAQLLDLIPFTFPTHPFLFLSNASFFCPFFSTTPHSLYPPPSSRRRAYSVNHFIRFSARLCNRGTIQLRFSRPYIFAIGSFPVKGFWRRQELRGEKGALVV
ncbi:uncharacterized protein F4822DRAFT_129953 [Hypoxylon trugodes]|uniref:uncharacterized protein n=1 Tax=Hypoxylon trugodes TaxID=326681 RepID=UPI0021A12034|nr:uncharacterized protein F4822DRAFT_129953 [Hypoxylon trugodes]KAI1392466.1 hypothetical protein F4822DRAFT_129953 [Hypoxylon trugodes]